MLKESTDKLSNYTFTKDIEDLKYARVYIINSAQENKDVVQNSGNQTFKINVGEKAKAEKDINVDFGKLYHAETSENVNGRSQFTEFNPETGEFTQVFYLNPESKEINTSSTNDQNGREWGKVGFLLSSPHDADKPRSIDYSADNTKIEVKKLPKGAKLPDAIIENPEGAQPATKVEGGFRNFKGEPMFTMNFGGGNKIDSPYVVVVKGHANKIDGKYTELYSNGTLYGDGEASLFLDNLYTVQENSTDSEGVKETLGYFKEHHIYITKENGIEKSRFEIPGATVSGTADEYYYTDKNIIPGYHFVKVDTDKLVNNPAYNDQGEITQGHYEVGKTKEVTYIYERDITTKGSFTEHHVYEVYKDGELQETSKIDIDKTEGSEKETFTTSAKPNGTADDVKEGFTLVKDRVTKSSEITENITGGEVTPNYINEKDLEVTYVYRKDITTKGSFTEHHVYEVYKDGELQETSKIDIDKTEGSEKETFTTSAKPNGTADDVKEGFTLVKDRVTKSPEITENITGGEVTPNYINEKDLEVTYVYRKDITTKGSFTEHHVYEVYKDGELQETSKIDIDKTEGSEKETFTTSAKPNGTADDVKEGFTLVKDRVTKSPEITENITGGEVTPNYINEKDLEVTYVYRKDITTKGSFTEHHVYEVYKDGELQETSKIDIDKTEGSEKETFTTSAKPNGTADDVKEGFTLVKDRVTKSPEITENITGGEVTPNYINEKDLEVTYVYRKDITTKGSFTEHHVYEVYKDGELQETSKIDIDKTEGSEKETFTTSAKPNGTADDVKEGFTLVKDRVTKSPEITENITGGEVTPNYINEKDLEVTYVYRKDITTKGSFTEHHVYEVYKDGELQEISKIDIDKTEGSEKETFTTSAKPNGTADDVKEGFTLVKDRVTKSPEITENITGGEVTPNYINEKDLEVTYVYRKDITTPEEPATPISNLDPKEKEDPKPSEPSTPRTPDPRPNTNPGPKEPNYPIVEEPKDPSPVEEKEKNPAPKEESPVQKPVEEVKEVPNKPVEVEKKQVPSKAFDDARAPQTFDPGVASYLGLAGLASGLMAYMEDRKRKNK